MNGRFNYMENVLCWVYITRKGKGIRAAYSVGYAAGVNEPQAVSHGMKVVYRQPFSDPLAALGHKLLLEQLSAASLRRLVRMHRAKPCAEYAE